MGAFGDLLAALLVPVGSWGASGGHPGPPERLLVASGAHLGASGSPYGGSELQTIATSLSVCDVFSKTLFTLYPFATLYQKTHDVSIRLHCFLAPKYAFLKTLLHSLADCKFSLKPCLPLYPFAMASQNLASLSIRLHPPSLTL